MAAAEEDDLGRGIENRSRMKTWGEGFKTGVGGRPGEMDLKSEVEELGRRLNFIGGG